MTGLPEIAALVHRESGILVREAQHDALAAALERIDPGGDRARFLRDTSDPVDGPRHVSRLLDEVTVKETYFMREADQLGQIPWHALLTQARKAGRQKIRVWSAGCATGEEAYSLALLACEAFGPVEPPVRILATDVSAAAVERARSGDYRPRSTRELGAAVRRRYFTAEEERFVAGPRLRSLVTFARHNLIHDPAPPLGEAPFDVILCRNVLIYFDGETIDRVLTALERALAPGGTLLLGAADALCRGATRLRAFANVATPLPSAAPASKRALRRPLGRLHQVADPLDASAHFLEGLAELEAGDAHAAVGALRRALYAEPRFGLAAFQLGRAYEALGNGAAAQRAYQQALRTLDTGAGIGGTDLHESLLGQVDLDEVTVAVRTRLDALAAVGV